ncbi:2-aminoethylphosphonate transport system ATP-binding protein [Arthrobacter alpinus]|uniref:ABC-type quaternary amine transporter n=1 Tax=Arthrobacter alpinus TaxID=656366 RepID=A0A1H5N0U7_9MICC|nr:ABC transporter ATP-binding protein [Arthrobacter alpinus]SEE94501.1 2-aminoethylphosphonate transport system ATP-binding protein [Arthrobacter alpinus]
MLSITKKSRHAHPGAQHPTEGPGVVPQNTEPPVKAVELRNVSVTYGTTVALEGLSLHVERGETVALLGPSGSGKSTALKAIAGFEQPSSGQILLDGSDVTGTSPAQRGIGVVVQSYALFPHMRIDSNVAYGLKARKLPKERVAARVKKMLEMVGMEEHAHKLPRQLSGGQQQRVAIARALAIKPQLLLLDEPLSALDASLRAEMLIELQALRAELPDIAMVYVTHDQSEALTLADRIAVMRNARLEEIGTADELYNRPRSAFTAKFLGGASLLPAVSTTVARGGGAVATVRVGQHRMRAVAPFVLAPGDRAKLAVRPHAWQLETGADNAVVSIENSLPGRVESVQWRGAGHRVQVDLIGIAERVTVDLPALSAVPTPGALVVLSVDAQHAVLVPAGDTP